MCHMRKFAFIKAISSNSHCNFVVLRGDHHCGVLLSTWFARCNARITILLNDWSLRGSSLATVVNSIAFALV